VAAQAVPWNATNQAVTYASSDPEVATVSASGVLTAIGPGELVVTVESKADPGIRDEMTVTVAAGDGVLHRTDFESGANGWPTDANRAIVDDGTGDHVLRIKNGANTQLDRQFSQYALDFTVTTPAEVPEGGQLLVYDRTGATPGGYVRYRHAAAGSTWTIFDSAWGTVKQVTLPAGEGLAPGTQYDVRVVVTADGVRVLLDGEVVVEQHPHDRGGRRQGRLLRAGLHRPGRRRRHVLAGGGGPHERDARAVGRHDRAGRDLGARRHVHPGRRDPHRPGVGLR